LSSCMYVQFKEAETIRLHPFECQGQICRMN
jgi:hypothetical protein